MIVSYLAIFVPVFAAGMLTGWAIPWFVRTWRASMVLIAEVKAAADNAVPYPTPAAYLDGRAADTSDGAEWDRIARAVKEDGL